MDSIKKKMEKLQSETAAAEARIASFDDLKEPNNKTIFGWKYRYGLYKNIFD